MGPRIPVQRMEDGDGQKLYPDENRSSKEMRRRMYFDKKDNLINPLKRYPIAGACSSITTNTAGGRRRELSVPRVTVRSLASAFDGGSKSVRGLNRISDRDEGEGLSDKDGERKLSGTWVSRTRKNSPGQTVHFGDGDEARGEMDRRAELQDTLIAAGSSSMRSGNSVGEDDFRPLPRKPVKTPSPCRDSGGRGTVSPGGYSGGMGAYSEDLSDGGGERYERFRSRAERMRAKEENEETVFTRSRRRNTMI